MAFKNLRQPAAQFSSMGKLLTYRVHLEKSYRVQFGSHTWHDRPLKIGLT
jgi:hypothetical protein